MATKLTIGKGDSITVSILIKVATATQPIDFRNSAMSNIANLDGPVDSLSPFLTGKAIEAACISGAIYARRKLGVAGLSVELLSFSWKGKVENAEPFAVAVMMAACKGIKKETPFLEREVNGWRELEFSQSETAR